MTDQEKNQVLAQLVENAVEALRQAEAFADDNGLSFTFEPEYGMGGYYDGDEGQWYPSSTSC